MKAILTFSAKAFVASFVLFAALNPNAGVIHQNAMTCLGLGLVGLGLCLEARGVRANAACAVQKN